MKTVLVIEDEANILLNICTILQISGYSCIKASNGIDALQLLSTQQPHLILCDVMMPQMDGFEVFAKLKADSLTCNIPVVFVTAHSCRRRQG